VHRLHFRGENQWNRPWQLDAIVPPELLGVVSQDKLRQMAQAVEEAAAWQDSDLLLVSLTRIVCRPLSSILSSAVRSQKARAVADAVSMYELALFRDVQSNARGDCLRFGVSPDYRNAYVDVLVHRKNRTQGGTRGMETSAEDEAGTERTTAGAPIGQPRLPAVLPLVGDGSVSAPLRIDTSDVLVVSTLLSLVAPYLAVTEGRWQAGAEASEAAAAPTSKRPHEMITQWSNLGVSPAASHARNPLAAQPLPLSRALLAVAGTRVAGGIWSIPKQARGSWGSIALNKVVWSVRRLDHKSVASALIDVLNVHAKNLSIRKRRRRRRTS